MAGYSVRQCPACLETKKFRKDNKTCGCKKVVAATNSSTVPELTEKNEVSGNTWNITLPKTNIHTLPQLLEYFQVDTEVWEVERFVANKWEVVMKPAAFTELFDVVTPTDGGTITNTVPLWQRDKNNTDPLHRSLYQVKAFLRRKVDVVAARNEVEDLKKLAKTNAKVPPLVIRTQELKLPSGNMLEINIADHHFGKLAWGAETGGANYDVKIATELFNRAFETLLQRTSSQRFDEIWFVVGNDLLNSDDLEGRTTKGTYVSTDIRFHKTFSVVRNVIITAIERLLQITAKVKVIMVSGNHDRRSVWHLGDSLDCYFHNYSNVEIDNSPRYYKAHQFGRVMLMFTHGDKGKRKSYPLMMATEWPEMFGSTSFREAHTGHNHTEKVDEQHGVKTRILSALCPPDGWHAENAFVGNLRSSEAFVWNKDQGLIGTAIYTDNDKNIEKTSGTKNVREVS